jgi:glutamyl-tRNA synthetase
VRDTYGFFFDDIFAKTSEANLEETEIAKVPAEDRSAIAQKFLASYSTNDSQEDWFAKVKSIGEALGYTSNMKEYRKNPESFPGSVADVAMVLRVALTGRNRSPNLHEMMQVMGEERIQRRISRLVI